MLINMTNILNCILFEDRSFWDTLSSIIWKIWLFEEMISDNDHDTHSISFVWIDSRVDFNAFQNLYLIVMILIKKNPIMSTTVYEKIRRNGRDIWSFINDKGFSFQIHERNNYFGDHHLKAIRSRYANFHENEFWFMIWIWNYDKWWIWKKTIWDYVDIKSNFCIMCDIPVRSMKNEWLI